MDLEGTYVSRVTHEAAAYRMFTWAPLSGS